MTASAVLNRGGLARDLRDVVEGEVRFDEGSRALYANDASIYRQLPIGVVIRATPTTWWPRCRSVTATPCP